MCVFMFFVSCVCVSDFLFGSFVFSCMRERTGSGFLWLMEDGWDGWVLVVGCRCCCNLRYADMRISRAF